MCQLHRVSFAPDLVLQQIPPPYGLPAFQRAAQSLGLECLTRNAGLSDLHELPLPCLAVINSRAATADVTALTRKAGDSHPAHYALAIVLRCDANRILYIEEGSPNPESSTLSDFACRYAGMVMLLGREERCHVAQEQDAENSGSFGFRWFVPELLKHKAIWRDVLLASLTIQLMGLATPIFTQIVIDKVIVHHTMNTLIVIGVALFAVIVFSAGMNWIRQYLVLHTGNRIDGILGSQVFEHLFKLPVRYFENRSTGTLVARLHGVETIREFLSGAAVTVILDVPFVLIFLAIMLYYSWMLTLIVLALSLVTVALCVAITPLLRKRINDQFMLAARNQAFVTEYVAGIETVKALQLEPQLRDRFGEMLASYLGAGFKTRQLSNTYNVAASLLEQMITLSVLCVGAWIVMNNLGMTIGMLVAFQMFASRLSGPLLRMVGLWQEFQQADIAVKRLGDVMNAPAEPYAMVSGHESLMRGKIEFKDLNFRYNDRLPLLYRDLNLTVEPGQCIAIVGPSGAGKSTLAKLLQGFYEPTGGSILIDGHEIRTLSANELRRYFGIVPQETILFSGTIIENLSLANPHATFQQVIGACKLAEIHDVIEKLPEGYQTRIGERGIGLSGGQKQRIAIARALLKRPRILLFDESTSNLEQRTARQLVRTINRLKGTATMMYVTHQVPAELQVDRTIVLGQ